MKRTWVLVLDRMGARLFERLARRDSLSLLRRWEHLEGNLREHELISDRPCIARINSREYRNNVLNPAESAKEHSLKTFCKEIAHFLDGERIAGHYEELVLVAEPHTLGIMRASLNIKVKKLVSGSIEKDFGWIDNKEVSSRVLDYI